MNLVGYRVFIIPYQNYSTARREERWIIGTDRALALAAFWRHFRFQIDNNQISFNESEITTHQIDHIIFEEVLTS